MDEMLKFLAAMASACVVVATATWALRSKLDDVKDKIASALGEHAADDKKLHDDLNARVVRLEGRRGRR